MFLEAGGPGAWRLCGYVIGSTGVIEESVCVRVCVCYDTNILVLHCSTSSSSPKGQSCLTNILPWSVSLPCWDAFPVTYLQTRKMTKAIMETLSV